MKKIIFLLSVTILISACAITPEFTVNKEKCTGCWECTKVCPNDMIVKTTYKNSNDSIKEVAEIRTNRCVGCGKCFEKCHKKGNGAIECIYGDEPDLNSSGKGKNKE